MASAKKPSPDKPTRPAAKRRSKTGAASGKGDRPPDLVTPTPIDTISPLGGTPPMIDGKPPTSARRR